MADLARLFKRACPRFGRRFFIHSGIHLIGSVEDRTWALQGQSGPGPVQSSTRQQTDPEPDHGED